MFSHGRLLVRRHIVGLVLTGAFACTLWIQRSVVGEVTGNDRDPRIDVLFSPGGGCAERIVEEIGAAKETVRVQVYIFTSKPIANALIAAKKRGVRVEVILDKSQEKMTYGRFRVLRRAGIPVYFDREHSTANNKIILIDDQTIITGSYNFTKAAEEKNAENVLIIKGADDVFDRYLENFQTHREHSQRYSK